MDQRSRGSNLGAPIQGVLRCGDCGRGHSAGDDPLLTSRGRRAPEPLRVVLSRSMELPLQAQLWNTDVAPTLVAHGPKACDGSAPSGPELLPLPVCDPDHLMRSLASRGCNQVLWECGPELAAAAVQQQCVQELAVVVAPKLLGGHASRTPLGDLGLINLNQAKQLAMEQTIKLGDDLLLVSLLA